ncbi:hypothetical protein SASPL_123974 [Salvia splendens]|uniref:Transport inhibitor response 1 n=1 Tax=Salvia splendens TaxID=180675 RepID=A0A8X8XPL5_SALSN|nr:hypothetical protein SASPL_123974 [Salvia splendens]
MPLDVSPWIGIIAVSSFFKVVMDSVEDKGLEAVGLSCLLTDQTFEYIGKYAKDLETLSIAFVGSSDFGMHCILEGCPKLRKLEMRDCPFGDSALSSLDERNMR